MRDSTDGPPLIGKSTSRVGMNRFNSVKRKPEIPENKIFFWTCFRIYGTLKLPADKWSWTKLWFNLNVVRSCKKRAKTIYVCILKQALILLSKWSDIFEESSNTEPRVGMLSNSRWSCILNIFRQRKFRVVWPTIRFWCLLHRLFKIKVPDELRIKRCKSFQRFYKKLASLLLLKTFSLFCENFGMWYQSVESSVTIVLANFERRFRECV